MDLPPRRIPPSFLPSFLPEFAPVAAISNMNGLLLLLRPRPLERSETISVALGVTSIVRDLSQRAWGEIL